MTRPQWLSFAELLNREKLMVYQGSETVSGSKTIQTGVDEVLFCVAELDGLPSANAYSATSHIAAQASEPGQIELNVWLPTSISTNATPTTSAAYGKVKYFAIGRTSMTQ